MKKIFLSLFIFVVSFIFVDGVSADTVCDYGDYKIRFTNDEKQVFYKDDLINGKYQEFSVGFSVNDGDNCPEVIYVSHGMDTLDILKDNDGSIKNLSQYKLSDKKYYNNFDEGITSCGSGLITKIPTVVPKVISLIISTIQVAVPIVLVIMGMMDFAKSMSAGKEEDIKKGQKMFIKRLISGILIFCVFVIVKFVVSIVADNSNVMECADCFISGNCDKKVIK